MNHATDDITAITFCITELDVGGAEKAAVRIAIGLKQLGWLVRVISLRNAGPLAEPLIAAGIPVTALNCRGFTDLRAFFRLTSELRVQRPDIVCCFLHQANIYGRLAARRAGIPVVVSGVRVADRRMWVTKSDAWTRHYTDHYIAVSENVAAVHAQLCGIPVAMISAIPNGVDIPVPATQPEISQINPAHQDFELLFVGRLTEQKSPLDLLEAYQKLPAELRNRTRITFAGEGPLRQRLESRIAAGTLSSRVKLIGHSPDIPNLMKRATLLVLPSRWEGLPNAVLEAMAIGLPVVSTAVDGTRELISNGETGWLVPPGKPEALAAAIAEALNSPDLRRMYAKTSQVIAAKSFSWDVATHRYAKLLRALLTKNIAIVDPKNQI